MNKYSKGKKSEEHKKIKMLSPKAIIFFTLVTSIIVIAFSISRYESTSQSNVSGQVAKWSISLNTNENEKEYILLENKKANNKDYNITINSESETSSRYDIKLDGLNKIYNVKLKNNNNNYSTGYSFSENKLNIESGEDKIEFDLNNKNQTVNNYYMEKHTTIPANVTQISIKNVNSNKEILNFEISNDNKMKVVFGNCMELKEGKNKDTYNLNISTEPEELPEDSEIKVYALFEQLD